MRCRSRRNTNRKRKTRESYIANLLCGKLAERNNSQNMGVIKVIFYFISHVSHLLFEVSSYLSTWFVLPYVLHSCVYASGVQYIFSVLGKSCRYPLGRHVVAYRPYMTTNIHWVLEVLQVPSTWQLFFKNTNRVCIWLPKIPKTVY